MQNRSWVNINLKQIEENYKTYKSLIKQNQKIIAVVKANAYGHGDVEVATTLQKIGVCDFAVSNVDEGIKLRENGITGNLLILGYTPINRLFEVKKYNLSQTIISSDYLVAVLKTGLNISVQFKIETGMNRLGLPPNKATEVAIKNSTKLLNVQGIFTHLSTADEPLKRQQALNQINKFKRFATRLKTLKFSYVHYLNSAGGLLLNDGVSTHVRVGIILYGLKPNDNFILPNGIKPCLEWKTVITMIKTLKKGETVSYGATPTTSPKTVVATLSTGYADGFSRLLSNGGTVLVNGTPCKVLGKVCMDQFMIDITSVKGARPYGEVVIIGNKQTAEDIAKQTNTIPYEVVCQITSRVYRIYQK